MHTYIHTYLQTYKNTRKHTHTHTYIRSYTTMFAVIQITINKHFISTFDILWRLFVYSNTVQHIPSKNMLQKQLTRFPYSLKKLTYFDCNIHDNTRITRLNKKLETLFHLPNFIMINESILLIVAFARIYV